MVRTYLLPAFIFGPDNNITLALQVILFSEKCMKKILERAESILEKIEKF